MGKYVSKSVSASRVSHFYIFLESLFFSVSCSILNPCQSDGRVALQNSTVNVSLQINGSPFSCWRGGTREEENMLSSLAPIQLGNELFSGACLSGRAPFADLCLCFCAGICARVSWSWGIDSCEIEIKLIK